MVSACILRVKVSVDKYVHRMEAVKFVNDLEVKEKLCQKTDRWEESGGDHIEDLGKIAGW
jgi:hypothetical protein